MSHLYEEATPFCGRVISPHPFPDFLKSFYDPLSELFLLPFVLTWQIVRKEGFRLGMMVRTVDVAVCMNSVQVGTLP